jgi:hypothetical protein
MRNLVLTTLMLLICGVSFAQGPVFHQMELWAYPYEDMSDLLRRFPGMYPQDYGVFGAPVVFRPWGMNPWQMHVERDGIPQNRLYDGLYESNLQPAGELDSISYRFLDPGSVGAVHITSRSLPVDSPYTEFQIREGYYGYTTVDFAHAQRTYRSMTFELTGRLSWYNGMRNDTLYYGNSVHEIRTDAHSNRLRGKIGLDLSSRWRGELTYSGSNMESGNLLNVFGEYVERSEGILSFAEKDSMRTPWNPRLQLYVRQDREKWGNPFNAREMVQGWVASLHVPVPLQSIFLRHTGEYGNVEFPGFHQQHLLNLALTAVDSLNLGFGNVQLSAGVKRESNRGAGVRAENTILPDFSASLQTKPVRNISFHGGAGYVEESVPMAWRYGQYDLALRPLLIAPEFADTARIYNAALSPLSLNPDRYLKGSVGAGWQSGKASVNLDLMTLQRFGNFSNQFQFDGSNVTMKYVRTDIAKTQVGAAVSAVIPLWWGLRLDNWWSAQSEASDPGSLLDSRGYTRLYFERNFFTAPLIVRSHLSLEYFGERTAYSNAGTYVLGPSSVVGFRVSGTIKGVTLIWGTENILKTQYEVLPGYRMIGKEEYLQFIWRIWL